MTITAIRAILEGQLASLAGIVPAATIATSSVANPTVIATAAPHGIPVGTTVLATISGHIGSSPALSGVYRATATGASTLTLQTNAATPANVAVTVAGAGGTIRANLTAFENVTFVPIVGLPYEEPIVAMITPNDYALADGAQQRGIFQVALKYPIGQGSGAATARAEAIKAGFAKNLRLTSGGQLVKIMRTPEITRTGIDGDRDVTLVRIRFSDR